MIPGTPLIALYRLTEADVYIQVLVVYHDFITRGRMVYVRTWSPRRRMIVDGSPDGCLTLDLRTVEPYDIVAVDWELAMDPTVRVLEDYAVVHTAMGKWEAETKTYIRGAIAQYKAYITGVIGQ